MIEVTVNMSRDVADYFVNKNLTIVVDKLLGLYDFTNLPPLSQTTTIQRKVTVTNPLYISLYQSVGPQSKMVSLSRLLEFAYNMQTDLSDVPVSPRGRSPDYIKRAITNLR